MFDYTQNRDLFIAMLQIYIYRAFSYSLSCMQNGDELENFKFSSGITVPSLARGILVSVVQSGICGSIQVLLGLLLRIEILEQ